MKDKYLKYVLTIDQRAVVRSGLKLDLIDCVLLDWFSAFAVSGLMETTIHEGTVYYWCNYESIIDSLPLLPMQKKDAVYRRFKGLIDQGVLTAHPNNKSLARSYYAFGVNYHLLQFGKYQTIGLKTGGATDLKPEGLRFENRTDSINSNTVSIDSNLQLSVPEIKNDSPLKGRHEFKNSEVAELDKFKAAFTGTEYEICDLEYYFEAVRTWAYDKSIQKRNDWKATARNFMLKDKRDGRMVTMNGNRNGADTLKSMLYGRQ
jgi:hypothetical protein